MTAAPGSPSSRRLLYAGVAGTAAATLMLEILLTRITSVVGWYHLAFFVLSLAMLGLTAGAIAVFLAPAWFSVEAVPRRLGQLSLAFALAIPVSLAAAMAVPLMPIVQVMDFVGLLVYGAVLAVPFALAGAVLTLALTRAGLPPGLVYGVDLLGAASGCGLVIPMLDAVDVPSAALLAAAIAALGAAAFGRGSGRRAAAALVAVVALAGAAVGNAATEPSPLRPAFAKGVYQDPSFFALVRWNTFSRVTVENTVRVPPQQWGQSRNMPPELAEARDQRTIRIDGAAATGMVRDGDRLADHAYLDWDITAFAHRLRPDGPAAVIGVGGGRDVIVAARAGHRPVIGIELNELILDLHTTKMADFSGLHRLPHVELVAAEARAFLEQDQRRYRVLAMSLIDTWASTGVGAYSLSENGLYTVEAWRGFLQRLEPDGIFTVSRWYHATSPGETTRMAALALDTLWTAPRGELPPVRDPRAHVVLLQNDHIATLLLSPTPFTAADLDLVQAEAVRLGFNMLATPRRAPSQPLLRGLWEQPDRAAMRAWAEAQELDLAAPTDDRPFFFNMLKPGTWLRDPDAVDRLDVAFLGNLRATQTLGWASLVNLLLTLVAIVGPLWARRASLRGLGRGELVAACTYFGLIGAGFMFVEIGFLSRLGVLLGHPTLALAVLLGGLIFFTGIGSLLSERVPLARGRVASLFPLGVAALVAAGGAATGWLATTFAGAPPAVRVAVALGGLAAPALAMGLCFPLGLRLCARLEERAPGLAPWLWGINGAAGVCAGGLALACSMTLGIGATLITGALAYVLLGVCSTRLARA